jgi:subfamily B ATP-binding cassette protein MsbA
MVVGLIVPEEGHLFVDGKDIREYNLNSYREKIGYISQESVIFSDTVFNNITFWAEKTQENIEKFNSVIKSALLNDFVDSLSEKEDTKLGDNGILISGGQRQRISIARELFKDNEILVFDEATSALDSETEKSIQENIEKLYGNFTLLLIAHRLSTIMQADKIFLLEDGKIKSSGNFEEMVENSDRFKKMVSLQGIVAEA